MIAPPPDDALLPMMPGNGRSAFDETPEQRHALYEELWAQGTLAFVYGNYAELLVNEEINREVGAFLRGKELRFSLSPLRPNASRKLPADKVWSPLNKASRKESAGGFK